MAAGADPIAVSLNVPVPGAVARLAGGLRPALTPFASVRERHTLVAKRLGERAPAALESRLRRLLSGTPAFEAEVSETGAFREPAAGPGPVVYLAVESPQLRELHRELCAHFDPVPGIEERDYRPHVTLARGGGPEADAAVERLLATDVEPVAWTVGELLVWDARYDEVAARISLPA